MDASFVHSMHQSDWPVPSAELVKAAEQFAQHQFWHCHETLEPLWLTSPEPLKLFYQGLIQAAAGFHHWTNGNQAGVISLLGQSIEKLNTVAHYPVFHAWMNLGPFLASLRFMYQVASDLSESDFTAYKLSKYPRWDVFATLERF